MTKINMELKGMDKLVKKLKTFGEQAEKETAMETKAAAQNIVADAKLLAPKDTGRLVNSITQQKIGDLTHRVYTPVIYAPYMEFGTGGLVSVPPELRDLAIRFKGKGIKKINISPQPFMYPAFIKNRAKYIDRLKQMLKRYAKDVTR